MMSIESTGTNTSLITDRTVGEVVTTTAEVEAEIIEAVVAEGVAEEVEDTTTAGVTEVREIASCVGILENMEDITEGETIGEITLFN